MLAPALDHLGRPTQIYVHFAVIQRAGAKMIGDMAGQRMTASRARTGGVIGEVRDKRCERLDPFDLDKIGPTPVPPARNRIGRRGARR